MKIFLNNVKANLFMSGHIHKNDCGPLNDRDNPFTSKMLLVSSSSLMLNCLGRYKDKPRGFQVLTFERKNNIVKKLRVQPFKFESSKILLDGEITDYIDIIYDDNIK